jgi:hypothetical protein
MFKFMLFFTFLSSNSFALTAKEARDNSDEIGRLITKIDKDQKIKIYAKASVAAKNYKENVVDQEILKVSKSGGTSTTVLVETKKCDSLCFTQLKSLLAKDGYKVKLIKSYIGGTLDHKTGEILSSDSFSQIEVFWAKFN